MAFFLCYAEMRHYINKGVVKEVQIESNFDLMPKNPMNSGITTAGLLDYQPGDHPPERQK